MFKTIVDVIYSALMLIGLFFLGYFLGTLLFYMLN